MAANHPLDFSSRGQSFPLQERSGTCFAGFIFAPFLAFFFFGPWAVVAKVAFRWDESANPFTRIRPGISSRSFSEAKNDKLGESSFSRPEPEDSFLLVCCLYAAACGNCSGRQGSCTCSKVRLGKKLNVG
jgi:hypothetical protein